MYRSNDPLADFERGDREQAKEEAKLPHCDYCGEPIYETYYEINDDKVCEECLARHFKREVEIDLD
jgi:formylmethanofuran dehydrogenase subunit E